MSLDLPLAAAVAEKVLLVAVGALFTWFLERRVRLVVYYGHVGVFRVAPNASSPPGTPALTLHTHTVVLRNTGRLPAHNVRLPHRGRLAADNIHTSVFPPVQHTVNTLPGGEEEILFPVIVPRQLLTISYLYFPPIVANQINLPISSDEGMAREVTVLLTRQWPRWLLVTLWLLIAIGLSAVLYLVVEVTRWLL